MKLMLLILGALLLVQLAHPIPVADPSSSSSSSEEEDTPRDVFFKQTVSQLFVFFSDTLKGLSTVFQNVITKAEHVENQSEELKKHLAVFTAFIDDVNEVTATKNKTVKVLGLIGLIKNMNPIIENYEIACRDYPEAFPEKLFLDKNGLTEMKTKAVFSFEEFEEKFLQTADAYVAGLTPVAAKKEQEFIDWYNKYKNADGIKTEHFFEFLEIYD